MEQQPLYTVAELATLLKVTTETVYRWVERSSIPHVRIGPSRTGVRFRPEDVRAIIQARPVSV